MPFSSTINLVGTWEYVSDQSPILHCTMAKFVNGKEITFWKHIVNIEYWTEIIDDFNGILQRKLALLDKAFSSINANRNTFAMISSFLCKVFNIFKFTNCKCKELES